jgi:hypothetical protein
MKQHVFISYSREDSNFVRQFIADLESADIPYWLDEQGIDHADQDFTKVINKAIETAFAAVLIASPASAKSQWVAREIDYIQMMSVDLLVIWASGDSYEAAVREELERKSYADCRREKYQSGIVSILKELRDLRDQAIPAISPDHGELPTCCFSIVLPDRQQVIVRSDGFTDFGDFLMGIYTEFLRDHYERFTYGRTWVLAQEPEPHYAKTAMNPAMMEDPSNGDKSWYHESLANFGISNGSRWYVRSLQNAGLLMAIVQHTNLLAEELKALHTDRRIIEKYVNYPDRIEKYDPEKPPIITNRQHVSIVITPKPQYPQAVVWIK